MGSVLDWLLHVPAPLVLFLVFLLPALEASAFVGLVVPGELAVLAGGALAHGGALSLTAVIVAAFVGAALGDQVGYLVGRRYGSAMLRRLPRRLRPTEPALDRALNLIRTRGAMAIVIGRWVAALRALVPGVAGMSGMHRLTFSLANVGGGALWAAGVAVAGYAAGASVAAAERRLGLGSEILTAAVLLGLVATWLIHRRRRVRVGSSSTNGP